MLIESSSLPRRYALRQTYCNLEHLFPFVHQGLGDTIWKVWGWKVVVTKTKVFDINDPWVVPQIYLGRDWNLDSDVWDLGSGVR